MELPFKYELFGKNILSVNLWDILQSQDSDTSSKTNSTRLPGAVSQPLMMNYIYLELPLVVVVLLLLKEIKSCPVWCWCSSSVKLAMAVIVLYLLYTEKIKSGPVWLY